jgi:hypothetical protein
MGRLEKMRNLPELDDDIAKLNSLPVNCINWMMVKPLPKVLAATYMQYNTARSPCQC